MAKKERQTPTILEEELKCFHESKAELMKHHEGQFALIKGSKLLGTYTTIEQAFDAGVKELGNQAFLIKEVKEAEDMIQFPALSVGMISAHS